MVMRRNINHLLKMAVSIFSSNTHTFTPSERNKLYEIMRDAYARTESEIWGENYVRIPKQEFEQLIDQEIVFGAQADGRMVGTLYLKKINSEKSSFGLLGVDTTTEGQGIGSKLIEAAEDMAREEGAKEMIIDILRPKDFELSIKNRLRAWYEKKGYEYTHSENFQDRRPDRAVDLKVPSVFDCFRKKLV